MDTQANAVLSTVKTTRSKEPTYQELKAKYDALLAQQTQEYRTLPIGFKISETTGVVSVIGLGKHPTSLYYEQWMRFFEHEERFKAFLAANVNNPKMKRRS